MEEVKLTDAQKQVMKWLGHGWESESGAGMAIHVNGKRICNVATLFALQKMGLVEQITRDSLLRVGEWKATDEGKKLTRELCL